MRSGVTFRPQNVEAIRRGPVDFLLSWIQSPDVDGHRVLANRLPFLFAPSAQAVPDGRGGRPGPRGRAACCSTQIVLLPAGDSGSVSLVVERRLGRLPHHAGETERSLSRWRWWSTTGRIISLTRIRRPTAGANGCASPTRFNLREQPTIITALSDVDTEAGARPREAADRSGY